MSPVTYHLAAADHERQLPHLMPLLTYFIERDLKNKNNHFPLKTLVCGTLTFKAPFSIPGKILETRDYG